MNNAVNLENLYGPHNYYPLPVIAARAKGCLVWDVNDKQYIDMMSAYSAVSFGHCNVSLVKALTEQAQRLDVVSRAYYSDQLGPFLQKACVMSGFERAFPMNSGAEAVETAIKAARKWAYEIKGVTKDQAEIIACRGNFHGRTITVVGMSSEESYKQGFGPFPAGFKLIDYGNADALEAAITPNTAAFLVEPIQGEGGIIVPPAGYLKKCREICSQNNVLLICDEIQSGLGRTGKLFAFQHENIMPDGLTLGKALGGGLVPVSLFLSNSEVMDVFTPGTHGSTFGGYPIAAAVGLQALTLLEDGELVARSAKMGEYMQNQLRKINNPLIKEIRGKGLFIGLEIAPPRSAREICLKLLENGLLSKETHKTVIRLAPPLIINKELIDDALVIVKNSLDELS